MKRLTLLIAMLAASGVLASTASAAKIDALAEGDDSCFISAESPTMGVSSTGRASGTGYLMCPSASPTNRVTATITVCAERAVIQMIYHLDYWQVDTCKTKGPVIIDQGALLLQETDTVSCGTIPMYRTTVTATVSGFSRQLRGDSDPRPDAC